MDYKEKLEEAKKLYKTANADQKYALELLFPELKRNKDGQIRDEICAYIGAKQDISLDVHNRWIAWLEKQGNEKPADKIEPKFKVGDWILYSGDHYEGVRHIIKINEKGYYIERNGLPHGIIPFNHEICMRLWTIQDAKDGDVLCDCHEAYDNPLIFILKKFEHVDFGLVRPSDYSSYCYLTAGDIQRFKEGTYHHEHNIKPATKEQRDLLFQKMKEAGYEWDAEKKELKKIHVIDEGKAEMDYCFTKMMNCEKVSSTWSEEDEKNLIEVISIVQNINSYDKQYDGYINWLKSIRQRHAWKPTKEQMYMLEWLTTNVLDDAPVGKKTKEVLYTLIEQLKSL